MKKVWLLPGSVLLLAGLLWFAFFRGGGESSEIEYRYEAATIGELIRSISATGQVVALTSVDVKSKAGGIVVRLAVDEGSEVKKGDLIAVIDPRDTQAIYDQAIADLQQAEARASQARSSLSLQQANSRSGVEEAQASLETARLRLSRAELEAKRQPDLTAASLQSAKAQHESAMEALSKHDGVDAPQFRRDVAGAAARARAEFEAARADLSRQEELQKQGYVAQSVVDRAKATFEAAKASNSVAEQRLKTLDRELAAQRLTLKLAADRAKAAYDEALASASQVQIAEKNLAEARKAVTLAEVALRRAEDARINDSIRNNEFAAAQAGTVRSKVALENAKVQLDSTTVLAPRDGVVTMKYLEEGTIIPPGTSLFAQGTSIVQLSDVTKLFVDCAVDEADIAEVREGQPVRIVTEAFPGVQLTGKVVRVNPAAQTEQNITAVKVRVQIDPGYKIRILPGMNASVEFLTLTKPNTLIVPGQAISREGGKTIVKVKTKNLLKPEIREVRVGESGNNGVEILEGLREGEEVVTAEIDLKELKETQQRMLEAMQGGGLAGGGPMGGRRTTSSGAGQRGGGGGSAAGRAGGGAGSAAPSGGSGGGRGGR
jgi:HlyD family secretion protein